VLPLVSYPKAALLTYNPPKLMIFIGFGALSALKTRQNYQFFIDLARYCLSF